MKKYQRLFLTHDFDMVKFVAGLGVEPNLKDYEPFVQPYTTPHVNKQG